MTAGRGPPAVGGEARAAPSRPVIPGMWMSISTSAGASSRMACERARAPSARQPTSSSTRQLVAPMRPSASRASGSSSAIRVVVRYHDSSSFSRAGSGSRRGSLRPAPSARWSSAEPSKSSSKRRLQRAQADAAGLRRDRRPAAAGAVVADRQRERVGIGAAVRLDRAPCRRRSAARCRGRCCSRPAAAASAAGSSSPSVAGSICQSTFRRAPRRSDSSAEVVANELEPSSSAHAVGRRARSVSST